MANLGCFCSTNHIVSHRMSKGRYTDQTQTMTGQLIRGLGNRKGNPSPASAKVSCQGANILKKKKCFWWFSMITMKKKLAWGLKKGPPRTKIIAVFPRGSKKRKSNNDDKHGHGQDKRRPSTLWWAKNGRGEHVSARVLVHNLHASFYTCPMIPA